MSSAAAGGGARQRQNEGSSGPKPPDHMCDMAFDCNLMADPVVASDGFTYERWAMEQWMKAHSTSPRTGNPLDHKFLIPNNVMRQQIAAWCEENGVSVPVAPKPAEADAPPPAVQPQLQKPQVTCAKHPDEQLRVFCVDCDCAVCVLCAVDVDLCKSHSTKAFKPLLNELQTDREGWARVQRECGEGAEQLCAVIQADGNAKKQAIDTQVAALQQQVRSAAAARCTALGAILLKRQEREELVAGAAASPQVAVKGSAAAAVVASALGRARAPIPPASAAEFRAAAAPAAAVGHVVIAPAVVDPESEAARAAAAAAEAARVAAAAEAAAVAAMGGLSGSALLQRVGDRNKVQQFAALMRTKLAGKCYRLLYTWSRDGRSNASFHQHCDNQGPTLVIARSSNGFTFGGYAAAAWNNGTAHIPAAGSFVFWVENPQGRAPGCLDCVSPERALFGGSNSAHGPTFGSGGGLDLHQSNSTSYAQPHAYYPDTTGLGVALFTGANTFTPEDYEVWAVT